MFNMIAACKLLVLLNVGWFRANAYLLTDSVSDRDVDG